MKLLQVQSRCYRGKECRRRFEYKNKQKVFNIRTSPLSINNRVTENSDRYETKLELLPTAIFKLQRKHRALSVIKHLKAKSSQMRDPGTKSWQMGIYGQRGL